MTVYNMSCCASFIDLKRGVCQVEAHKMQKLHVQLPNHTHDMQCSPVMCMCYASTMFSSHVLYKFNVCVAMSTNHVLYKCCTRVMNYICAMRIVHLLPGLNAGLQCLDNDAWTAFKPFFHFSCDACHLLRAQPMLEAVWVHACFVCIKRVTCLRVEIDMSATAAVYSSWLMPCLIGIDHLVYAWQPLTLDSLFGWTDTLDSNSNTADIW